MYCYMKIRNCKRCGKVFVYNGVDLCPDCLKEDEDDFKKIEEVLTRHPRATVFEISELTGIDSKKIWDFLKQGKLELADNNSGIQLKCERCGRPISSGRFCSRCLKVINDRLKIEPENEQKVKKNEKFHIQDRIKRH